MAEKQSKERVEKYGHVPFTTGRPQEGEDRGAENQAKENYGSPAAYPRKAQASFATHEPQEGKTYSGRITYVDDVRDTFITQYEYESGRLGYPVEHSMDKVHFPNSIPTEAECSLQVGDVVEVSYPRGKDRCDVKVIDTAESKELVQKWRKEKEELEAARSERDKGYIKKYANPKNAREAETKKKAELRESSRNKRFENVIVTAKDDRKKTVTTSNGKGDEFVHEAEEWDSFETLRVGDTVSIDYLKQRFPDVSVSRPRVIDYDEEKRIKARGYGDINFARGGEFDHVRITAIDNEKNAITTIDGKGKAFTHDTSEWGPEKALYEIGDIISLRLPEKGSSIPVQAFNHTYYGRLIDKYKMFDDPFRFPRQVLYSYPQEPKERTWCKANRVKHVMEDIKRLFAYDLADGLNPYKSLKVMEIDNAKDTITTINDKGEASVHSIADFRYKHDLRVGDIVTVRYNDINSPEKGLKIFNQSAYERHKIQDRFKEVRVVAVNRDKDYFTTQDRTGEKFNHSMRGYRWKSRLQVGHLVTIQYKDNDTSKANEIFDHTTYQESLIKSLQKRTQEEALIKRPEKVFTSTITVLGKNYVFLDKFNGNGKPFFVSMDDLTKALDCKDTDLKRRDEIQFKVKSLPKADGSREILSAQSKDVEERIQRQSLALGR